ncbi:MAG: deoxycytidylate deaminase [Alphaproteobacteria bacterium]|nr:deoxycytidylate deaminase [Alphaproteobacteria bacterium]NCQ89077.1 deoxycytidylate deaminase [Alphaproteobacteria bacterium]NCT07977.1 deoxycytidylate deaminase [Alphaproteobacteria bacterium]
MISPFTAMQDALDLVPTSPHPSNKIAASVFGRALHGKDFWVTHTNHWPDKIATAIGVDTKIGNSSGTIHAETACLLDMTLPTEGASLCVTDPFCPNCAKNIAEAGIKNIYIDEQGFEKDFFKRRSGHFDTMSMQIAERAGINVYALNMITKKQIPILEIDPDYKPIEDSPIDYIEIKKADEESFTTIIFNAEEKHKRRKFAIALVDALDGRKYALIARAHAVIGYSLSKPDEAIELLTPIDKYSFIQEPVNRLMMHLARKGHRLISDFLYCSQVPTSREQVNLVGARVKRITIGNIQKCRDPHGLKAMKQLQGSKIIDYG